MRVPPSIPPSPAGRDPSGARLDSGVWLGHHSQFPNPPLGRLWAFAGWFSFGGSDVCAGSVLSCWLTSLPPRPQASSLRWPWPRRAGSGQVEAAVLDRNDGRGLGASSFTFIVDAQTHPQSYFCQLRNGVIFSASPPSSELGGLGPVH